jgi:hypothetical protein
MKKFIHCLILVLILPVAHYAQTQVNKVLPVQQGQKIVMHFDYPEMIRVSTWDKNEVSIQGSVMINGGENDDAFELHTSTSDGVISISSEIKNIKSLPQRITVVRDGQKTIFRDKAELKKYQDQNGKSFECQSWGVDMDIVLEIKVPRGFETKVESVYGFVEIKNFNGPLTAISTYGGVDAALAERQIGEIIAETNYGEIYTNFDTRFGGSENNKGSDFHTYVSAKPGTGPRYSFESKYGNVYLRKAN